MKYYKVVCVLGHQGGGNFKREIAFGIEAKNIIEASDKAKKMPAVKHRLCVLSATEISIEDYNIMIKRNAYRVALGQSYKTKS